MQTQCPRPREGGERWEGMEEHGEGGGRDKEEDLEKKEGEKMAIYSSGFRGRCKKHTLPFFSS